MHAVPFQMWGMDAIIGLCMGESSKDSIKIVKKLMDQPFCHMHGPEHHVMVGAALLVEKCRRRY